MGTLTTQEWRERTFRKAGFSDIAARLLAVTDADTVQVLRALKNGCPLDLAMRIFV